MENEKKQQARNLYLQSDLTQAQIADIIGVSQKTVSQYVNENKWQLLKDRAKQMPALFLEQMIGELEDINQVIASRPKGERHPTLQEAEVRRKIMYSMASVKERQSVGTHIEAVINFLAHVAEENPEHARLIARYSDQYFTGKLETLNSSFHNAYSLPGGPEETVNSQQSNL
ncbi:MAG: helix-turn-helix protein [Flavipsychrobacter sp.]|jgi:predicted transcriptional regulator|nr:helix-turn-helix protein [Flavipsychrobacter sp.]